MLVLIKFFENKRLDHYSDSKTLKCSNLGKISTWQSVTPWSCVRNAQVHKYHPNLATSDHWPRVTKSKRVWLCLECRKFGEIRGLDWVHYRLSCGLPDRQSLCSDRDARMVTSLLYLSSILVSRANCTKLSAAQTPTHTSHQAQYTTTPGEPVTVEEIPSKVLSLDPVF